jgi:hypothetical protein
MPLSDLFYELLAQGGEVKLGVQRVGERHPVEYRPRFEILTQDRAHLPKAGECPDLWASLVGEHVLPDALQGFEHHGAGERQEWEGEHEALDLPPYLVDGVLVRAFLVPQALHGRTGLEFHAVHLDGSTTRDLYSVQNLRIAGYHCGVRVEPVGGGAHYDHVNGLFHKIKARDLRRVGVRDDGDSISFYPEDRRARTT